MTWIKETFLIALPNGPTPRSGWTYGGCGVHQSIEGSPKGRRPPTFTVTHLGSGHALAHIDAIFDRTIEIATEIADAGDWSFDGLDGYKNQFPDAPKKVGAIIARHRRIARRFHKDGVQAAHEGVAREIAMARA
jgi:hypothetical protein